MLQLMGRLSVELAFPLYGMSKLPHNVDLKKEDTIAMLTEPGWTNYCGLEDTVESLIAGSKAEGLSMEELAGYDEADVDAMDIRGGGWVVHAGPECSAVSRCVVCSGSTTAVDESHLEMVCTGCPPAYCQVKVAGSISNVCDRMGRTAIMQTLEVIQAVTTLGTDDARKCLISRYDQAWLSSYEILQRRPCRWIKEYDFQGPAGVVSHGLGSEDIVFTLICCSPLRCMDKFHKRVRAPYWPSDRTLERLRNTRGMIVCMGHRLSPEQDQHLQFRFSFSCQELLLANDMPPWVKQGYIAFKLTVKTKLLHVRGDTVSEGRSKISDITVVSDLYSTQ